MSSSGGWSLCPRGVPSSSYFPWWHVAGAISLGAWRLSINGGSPPSFNAFENPAALHPHPLYRALSVVWVWAEYAHCTPDLP